MMSVFPNLNALLNNYSSYGLGMLFVCFLNKVLLSVVTDLTLRGAYLHLYSLGNDGETCCSKS